MSCRPVSKREAHPDAAEIAAFLYQPNMIPLRKGFQHDEQANRRLFAEEVIKRLIDGGWRCLFPAGEFTKFYESDEAEHERMSGEAADISGQTDHRQIPEYKR
jgi:hypothetical protein